ncbi:uncharacterized [Tachysurus ichikawai]
MPSKIAKQNANSTTYEKKRLLHRRQCFSCPPMLQKGSRYPKSRGHERTIQLRALQPHKNGLAQSANRNHAHCTEPALPSLSQPISYELTPLNRSVLARK